jgi:hypothetical protein
MDSVIVEGVQVQPGAPRQIRFMILYVNDVIVNNLAERAKRTGLSDP